MHHSDSKYVKASAAYTIGNYLLRGISFFTLPLFVRLMTTADYGNFNTYVAYESIFNIIVGLALHASLKNAKYRYKKEGEFESYVVSCIQIGILSTVLMLILCNITYPLYAHILDMSRGIFNLMILESYAVSLVTLYHSYISLYYKYRSFLMVSFINTFANIGLSLFLMFTVFSANRYLARVVGTSVPVIIIGITIVIYFIKLGGLKLNREHWVYGVKFSFPLVFHGVSQVVLNQFDRIMIKTMTGAVNAGVYSFAYNISSLVLVTSTSLQQVWQPWFYERMEKRDFQSIRKRGDHFSFGMMLFVACVILGVNEIVTLLGTKNYHNSIYYLIPILIGGYFSFLYTLPAQVEYYYEKTNYIALGTCAAALMNVIMNYFGVKFFGSIAAAYTTLFIYCIYFFIHYYISVYVHGGSIFELKKLIVYGSILFVIGAVSLILIDFWYIRWILVLSIGIYMLYWLNKTFSISEMIKNKFSTSSKS